MTSTSNGTTTMGRTFFRYLRPAVNGFGDTDEPNPIVAQALNRLVGLLGMGFVDRSTSDDGGTLIRLREKLKRLENEDENGTRAAIKHLRYAIGAVGDANIKLNNAESDLQRRSTEVTRAQDVLNALKQERQTTVNEKPESKKNGEVKVAPDDIEIRIREASADLDAKQDAESKAQQMVLKCKNILANCYAEEETARTEVSRIENEVKSDVEETLRAMEAMDLMIHDNNDYRKLLSLHVLPNQDGQRTKFKMKIGKDSSLNTCFIMVDDKIGKSTLSFNAKLFLKNEVIKEYLFLRASLIDGLKDVDAIFDRMIDDQDGGIKYLYDYVVEEAITKIIKAKKLNDD